MAKSDRDVPAAEDVACLQSLNIDLVCYVSNNITRPEFEIYFLRLRNLLSVVEFVKDEPLCFFKDESVLSKTEITGKKHIALRVLLDKNSSDKRDLSEVIWVQVHVRKLKDKSSSMRMVWVEDIPSYILKGRSLSDIIWVENIPLRVLKGQNKILGTNLDYLVSLPIEYNNIRFHILLKTEDLYVVGIEMREKCYMYCSNEKDEVHRNLVKKCLETYKGELIEVNVGNSYAALEQLAQLKRADLKVDKQLLLELCNNIVTIDLGMVDKILGKTLLMITQLLCEPLRIRSFARHIFSHFDDPPRDERYICIFPHQKYLALEHFWKHGSVILLRGPCREFVVTLFDEMDNKVDYVLLHREFGILKRFEGSQLDKEFCELDISHKASKGKTTVIISKLLHAYFGKSIKELIKPLRSKEADGINCTGNVKIHIYSRYVVLQYNYNCSLKDVTVSVNPSNGFTRSQLKPLTSLWRKSFVAFERNDSTSSTFSTSFSGTDGNGLFKEVCFLEFGVSARDFFRGSGTNNLVDWKNIESDINLKIDFGKKLTFEEAKTATTEIFDMKDVTHQVVPRKMSSGIALFRSLYMNTHEVLIRVQDLHRNDTAKAIDLCVKCKEDEILKVIREILVEWVKCKEAVASETNDGLMG